jgi:GTP-binding protein
VPFSIIFTKTDKKSKSEVGKNIAKFNQVLTETWEELPQQFMASAVKKTGRDEILNHIGDILKATKS